MQKKLLFIVNPRAGKLKSRAPLFDAVGVFSSAGYLVSVECTSGRGDATDIAAAKGASFDTVVCCGGDGTLSETVTGLMRLEKRPSVGYIPAGTTNDFAACLHIPKDPVVAAKIAVGGVRRRLDVGWFNERNFVYVASFGAFSAASYTASQAAKNALGQFAYVLGGIHDLTDIRPFRIELEADGERLDGDYLYGSVSNSTSIGGVVKLKGDEVVMDDGKFELLLVRSPKNPLEIQALAAALLSQHYEHKGIVFRHVSSLNIRSSEEIHWSLDGEFETGAPEISIRSDRRAITMMT
jgi:diacylglycerol kinase (ATP)